MLYSTSELFLEMIFSNSTHQFWCERVAYCSETIPLNIL